MGKKLRQHFYSTAAANLCGGVRQFREDGSRDITFLCVGDLGGGSCSWGGIGKHRRHLSVKTLIRECSSRIPVFMMDEYGTSFSCPGCGGYMITKDKLNRVRTCKGNSSNGIKTCSLKLDDRDENSAAQMILGAVCRIVHGVRPPHLRRPTAAATTTTSSPSSSQ